MSDDIHDERGDVVVHLPDLWDKPNGFCGHCGAPLNTSMVGGYKLHDSEHAVSWACNATKEQIEAAIKASEENIEALKKRLASGSHRKGQPLAGNAGSHA